MSLRADGLNEDHHWEPYLWIGIGAVVVIVIVVLMLHRHRQRAAIRDMGSTFTAAGFRDLMDNLSWYGQGAQDPERPEPLHRAPAFPEQSRPRFPEQARLEREPDLGYRAGLQDAQNSGAAPGLPEPPYGQTPYEQTSNGQTSNGQTAYGRTPFGQAQGRQTAYGQAPAYEPERPAPYPQGLPD